MFSSAAFIAVVVVAALNVVSCPLKDTTGSHGL